MKTSLVSLTPVWFGIALAFGLWTMMFGVKIGSFWMSMVIATTLLSIITLYAERDLLKPTERWGKTILWGVGSAVLLYIVFWVGDWITKILPFQDGQVKAVYGTKEQANQWLIGLLLLCPIGPGEEIFWRGLVQKRMVSRWGFLQGVLTATLIYGAVHIASLNPILILAALVCGAFWGLLYHYTRSIRICMLSHAVWDLLIFIIIPLR